MATACGTGQTGSAPTGSAIPSTIDRKAALDLVRANDWSVARVDRIEGKLMTFAEYLGVAGPVKTHPSDPSATPMTGFGIVGDPNERYVWAVAVAGEVYPQGRIPVYFGHEPPVTATPFVPYRWIVWLVDAARGELMTIGDAGASESWPPFFNALPDHPAAAYASPSPTQALPLLAIGFHSAQAMTDVVRRTAEVRRTDRVDLKLLTWGEYRRSGGPGSSTQPDVTPVWIVALSGDIATVTGSARWALYSVDAGEKVTLLASGNDRDWPSAFDQLPSHPDPLR